MQTGRLGSGNSGKDGTFPQFPPPKGGKRLGWVLSFPEELKKNSLPLPSIFSVDDDYRMNGREDERGGRKAFRPA